MSKRFFRIKEAVDYSGLGRTTIYNAFNAGELKFTKFKGATRIEKCDLDEFLDNAGRKVSAAA